MISPSQREQMRLQLQDALEWELLGLQQELALYQEALADVPMEDQTTADKYQSVIDDTEHEISTVERKLFEVRNYCAEEMDLIFEADRIEGE